MSYQQAIKEAFALAKNIPILDTLEIVFPPTGDRLFLVAAVEDVTAKLETGEEVTFKATSFAVELPAKDENGFQEMAMTIGNANLIVSDFINKTLEYDDKLTCYYRPYLANNLESPEMNPPLRLTISDVKPQLDVVNVRASFADIINRRFLTFRYTKTSNPSL